MSPTQKVTDLDYQELGECVRNVPVVAKMSLPCASGVCSWLIPETGGEWEPSSDQYSCSHVPLQMASFTENEIKTKQWSQSKVFAVGKQRTGNTTINRT